MSKIFALSLFSGAGGMDLGVMQASFEILACIEVDKNCCETLRKNFADTKIFEGDIKNFEPKTFGKVDFLFGGSPCQAFSQAGKKLSLNDERGELIFEFIRFAREIKPSAIMIEQVKGFLTAKGNVFKNFIIELENLGYIVKWKVLSAANYGVAQIRERLFIVAMTTDNFNFLQPTYSAHGNLFCRPYKTVEEILHDLPSENHIDITPRRDRERIHGVPEGKYLSSQTQLPKEQICVLTKKDTTKFLRLDRNKPSNTLRGGEIFFHPTEDRYLTPREYMRIQGYPDDYILCGPIRGRSGTFKNLDQYRQISNSVPPPLAKVVAEKIMEALLCQKSLNSSAIR